jgi:hypothetical protein
MWFLVQVARGNKHFEAESRVGNRVLISDTTDMVITGRTAGSDSYRFEARTGNESFVLSDFPGIKPGVMLTRQFMALAERMSAISIIDSAEPSR